MEQETEAELRARLHGETAQIPWRELQRFFASGVTVAVSSQLDLLDVAYHLSQDNKASVAGWMDSGGLGRVTDEQALAWLEADATVWSVVVKPWVLVQEIEPPQ